MYLGLDLGTSGLKGVRRQGFSDFAGRFCNGGSGSVSV